MVFMKEKNTEELIDLEQYALDGRLTEPSDGKVFEYHQMYELVQRLGRPLTEIEAEQFRV